MGIFDNSKKYLDVMLHPGTSTIDSKTIEQGIVFYLKALPIPVILSIFLLVLMYLFGVTPNYSNLRISYPAGSMLFFILALILLVVIFALQIIVILMAAAIYHLFGRVIFRKFQMPLVGTFTAAVYGSIPYVLLVWLTLLPVIGSYAGYLLELWGIVVFVIAISNQQHISRKASAAIFISAAIILVLIIFTVLVLILSPKTVLSFLTQHSLCLVPPSGFACSNLNFSTSGAVSFKLGQDTGNYIRNIKADCFVNFNKNVSISYRYTISTSGTKPVYSLLLHNYPPNSTFSNLSLNSYYTTVFNGSMDSNSTININNLQCRSIYNGTMVSNLQKGQFVNGVIFINYTPSAPTKFIPIVFSSNAK